VLALIGWSTDGSELRGSVQGKVCELWSVTSTTDPWLTVTVRPESASVITTVPDCCEPVDVVVVGPGAVVSDDGAGADAVALAAGRADAVGL
jgi:hypothetical protein